MKNEKCEVKNKRYILLIVCVLSMVKVSAQEYHGLTGLLHVPCAETDSAGSFRGNIMFLDNEFVPTQMPDKDTFNYGVGVSVWRWLEVSYCATLLWMRRNGNKKEEMGYYNEDRRVNVKVAPLYEGRWWPAIAVGMDDVGRIELIKNGENGNNYFQNIYIAASKHFDICGYELGAHLAYCYYTSNVNRDRRGLAGGLTFRPAFYRPLRLVAEWDGLGVNVGADVLLWRHLFVQAALVHGRGFTGGLSYHYTIPF